MSNVAARAAQRRAKLAERSAASEQRKIVVQQRRSVVQQRQSAALQRVANATERRLAVANRTAMIEERRAAAAQRLAEAMLQDKSWLARSRAWISLLLLVPVATLALFAPPHFTPGSAAGISCAIAGYLLFAVGVAWRWWATLYIGGMKDHEVISQGAYSVCRNPLYFGTLLMTLSVACLTQSLSLGVTMVIVAIYYLGVTVANEEQRLARRMGQPYLDYKARVPRLWPRLSLYQSPEFVTVDIDGLKSEAIRALRYAFIPLLCQGVMLLRESGWLPEIFPLP